MKKHRHPGKYKSRTKKGKVVRKRKPLHKISKSKMKKNKNLTWQQLKKKYPDLDPNSDSDGDGVINKKDCRPFDKTKQDFGISREEVEDAGLDYERFREELLEQESQGELDEERLRRDLDKLALEQEERERVEQEDKEFSESIRSIWRD